MGAFNIFDEAGIFTWEDITIPGEVESGDPELYDKLFLNGCGISEAK